jgi:hypothetical protein
VREPTTTPWRVLLPVGILALLALARPLDVLSRNLDDGVHAGAPRPLAALHATAPGDSLRAAVDGAFGRTPLAFEPNVGQTDAAVDFLVRRPGYALFLTPAEAVFAFETVGGDRVLRVRLDGARRDAAAAGEVPLAGRVNYLIGNDPAAWRTDVPTWGRVRYAAVYPGVDLVWYGNGNELEYDFVVAPGADPSAIRLVFDGAAGAKLAENGDLLLEVGGREVRQTRPVIWQETAAGRREVEGGYALEAGAAVRFDVGAYDRSLPLVIDPVLVYGTFLGGTSADGVEDVAVDGSGNAYATGETNSPNFPTDGGVPINAPKGQRDVFVTKLNTDGDDTVYSTYIGGSGLDRAFGIAVDDLGRAHVTGSTESTNFPTAAPAGGTILQPAKAPNATRDGFVFQLNPNGNTVRFGTYLGGDNVDSGVHIALNAGGDVWVAGDLESDAANLGFTPPAGALQPARGGGRDGFVARFQSNGDLEWFTYFGGSFFDEALNVAVDDDGNSYVTGVTSSSNLFSSQADQTFATFDAAGEGASDGFIVKLGPDGDDLIHGSFLGGTEDETGHGVAIDADGNAYVTGSTTSADFPTAGTPFQGANAGDPILTMDAFVTKVNAAGDALVYSTYLGGTANDVGMEIGVDPCGRAFVVGTTDSGDFPTANSFHDYDALNDAFVTGLGVNGSGLTFSTFLGNLNDEQGNGIVVVGCGDAVYAGGYAGNLFRDVVTGSFDTSYNGGATDGFVLKIDVSGDADLDGIPDQLEADNLPPTDPETKDNDVFTADAAGNRLFAMQQFRDFVDREGLEGGITFWANALTNATATRAEVVRFFYNSAEYQNEFANVIRLALAHRQGFASQIPVFATLQDLFADFQGGADLFALSADLATDPEWIARYGTGAFPDDPAGNDAFVTLVFNDLLGRAPAQAGLDYWSNQLDADDITRADLFVFIAGTGEFQTRIANEQFVVSIFTEMLQRAPAQGGFTFWVNQLDGGGSNLVLINTVLGSSEYQSRFLP